MTKKIEGMADIEELPDGRVKVHFEPGCFDSFEGTQEELDEAIAMIQKMFEDGVAQADVNEVDLEELMETDPELAEKIFESLQRLDNGNEDEPPTRMLQ